LEQQAGIVASWKQLRTSTSKYIVDVGRQTLVAEERMSSSSCRHVLTLRELHALTYVQIGFIVTNMIIAGIFSGGTINLSFLDRLLTFWLEMGVTYMLVSELKAFEIIFKAKTAEIHLWMVYFILVAITVYLYPFINGSE
jgi:hypothetical protein